MPYDVITLTQKLVSFPSITPKDEGAQDYLTRKLKALGFECFSLPFGEGEDVVPNLFARIGSGSPHICFAGHTDVVPVDPVRQWTYPPFSAHIEDGVLYGRGSSDMKGGIAAFLAAVSEYLEQGSLKGSISFLITGDEEAKAVNGTVKVLKWMEENDCLPDVCLVGEPSNPDYMGQAIKTGRRGSLNGTVTVHGKSAHVAYPHLGDNAALKLTEMINTLGEYVFDQGTEHFEPTNLEITTVNAGNFVDNIIPNSALGKFNVRFNDLWTIDSLVGKIREILDETGHVYDFTYRCDAESTVTPPCGWTALVRDAVEEETGNIPIYSANGGTSDARFIGQYCSAIEFGVMSKTIHQIDECVSVDNLKTLTRIYKRIIETADSMRVEDLNRVIKD